MTKVRLIAALLLCVCCTAHAESAPREDRDERAARYRAQHSTIDPFATRSAAGLVEGGNECAPDRAVPVWGGGSALLGYRCVDPLGN
jgi:hypothetical protein